MKRILILAFLMIFLVASVNTLAETGIPTIPNAFYGTVNAPDGATVTAKLNGIEADDCTVSDGEYGYGEDTLVVNDDVGEGGLITFYVDGVKANEDYTFVGGEPTLLDLTVDLENVLEILTDSIEINGASYSDNFEVSPGEEVTVEFEYKNNLDTPLGYLVIAAESDQVPDFVDYSNIDWVLLPGTAHDSFEFTVPYSVRDDFTVTVLVEDEDTEGNPYGDHVVLTFDLVLENKDVVIMSAELEDDELTCSLDTDLDINLKNIGSNNILPEIYVFTEPATMDPEGDFDLEPLAYYLGNEEILPGENDDVSVPIDASGLSGTNTLYIYVVSPFFWDNETGFYPGDTATVTLTKSSCIESYSPSGNEVSIVTNGEVEFSVELVEEEFEDEIVWSVGDTEEYTGGTFEFSSPSEGSFVIKADVNEVESPTWTVTVTGPQEAGLSISEILFDDVEQGDTVSREVTITNTGTTEGIIDLVVELVDVDDHYSATVSDLKTTTLGAGEETTVQLELTIPDNERTDQHDIGTFKVTGLVGEEVITQEAAISLNPTSNLAIDSVEINGRSSGDLLLDEVNEIEVTVKNNYAEDMNDVVVTVKILDVDGDDLEEEANDFDLDSGDEETVTLEFDLSGEDLDDETYTIEIIVEGKAADDTDHETRETRRVSLDLERHQIIIEETSITNNLLECSRQATLEVVIKNTGRNDENDVEIKITNDDLGIDLSKDNIKLDKYVDRDNDYEATFILDLEDAEAGTYPIKVAVYSDGELEERTEVTVEVEDCFTSGSSEVTYTQLAQQLQEQLEQRANSGEEDQTTVRASFRDSSAYLMLLGTLAVLVLIAVVMALAIAVVKKR